VGEWGTAGESGSGLSRRSQAFRHSIDGQKVKLHRKGEGGEDEAAKVCGQ